MKGKNTRPVVAVHKFSSCDGCQLAFLNLGEALLELDALVDIRHFIEAGAMAPEIDADIAFVEGSISTPEEVERIERIRRHSRFLVTIGACATSGGLQALRNLNDSEPQWRRAIYAQPEYIETLAHAEPVSARVKVDLELWGCPINPRQLVAVIRDLLFGVPPALPEEKVCLECKRRHAVCVMVTSGKPCMGPVTQTGCGALCPRFGRDCYACFGPAENANTVALADILRRFGLSPREIAQRFLFINSNADAFRSAGETIWPEGLYSDDD